MRRANTILGASKASSACLVCRSEDLAKFLDFGTTPLANRFLSADELDRPEPVYPLRAGFCRACGHVQLLDIVPAEAMFTDYLYVSGVSDTLRDHLYSLSDVVVERLGLGPVDLVVDVGSNDGTLLSGFARHGVRALGVDPAKNLAAVAVAAGVDRVVDFFGARTAQAIRRRWDQAAAITVTNTFPHLQDLKEFLEGVDHLLRPHGVLVIEAHYLVDLLEQMAFDTIYHEHVSYWSLSAMRNLFGRHGMEIVDVQHLPIHHGQLRVFVQKIGESRPTAAVSELLRVEDDYGIREFSTFEFFARRAYSIRSDLLRLLDRLRSQGRTVVGYGAPAKGNTLLAFLEIGPESIPYIADRSPLKQGRVTPGTHIPIVAPSRIFEDLPDYVLIFAWNFAQEITQQLAEYKKRGGRFILPVPQVRVVP